jgi:hypothetical protein
MAKQRIVLLVICLFISAALVGTQTQVGTATLADSIYILLDGTIMPSTAPIRQSGDTYQLTGNIIYQPIIVEKNNIVLDGRGYTLQGTGIANGLAAINLSCTGVTVMNFQINDYEVGILCAYDNNRIDGNDFTRDHYDIAVYADNYEITQNYLNYVRIVGSNIHVYENEIQVPDYGTAFWLTNSTNIVIEANIVTFTNKTTSFISASGDNPHVFHNNFLNADELQFSQGEFYLFDMSGLNSFEPWDNGYPSGGNYWSDYTVRYGSASEIGDSGIWDTGYALAAYFNAPLVDRYPLVDPYPVQVAALPTTPPPGIIDDNPTPSVPELPIWAILALLATAASAVVALKKKTKKRVYLRSVTSAESP